MTDHVNYCIVCQWPMTYKRSLIDRSLFSIVTKMRLAWMAFITQPHNVHRYSLTLCMLGNLSSAKMSSAEFLKLAFSSNFFQRNLSEWQTVWILMRRHVLWRLIWIQTVCKGLQNSVPALKEVEYAIYEHTLFYDTLHKHGTRLHRTCSQFG